MMRGSPDAAKGAESTVMLLKALAASTNKNASNTLVPLSTFASPPQSPLGDNSKLLDALIKQELERRSLLALKNMGVSNTDSFKSLLLQRSLSMPQQAPLVAASLPFKGDSSSSTSALYQKSPSPQFMLQSTITSLPTALQGMGTVKKGRTGAFPKKLYQMLMDMEAQPGGTAIASFLPHGRSFVIRDPKEFTAKVMPRYFRMSRFSSFQRQLNLYEFHRVTDGPFKGSYCHELFIRGHPELCASIKRNKNKSANPTTKKQTPVETQGLIAGGSGISEPVSSSQSPSSSGFQAGQNSSNLSTAILLQSLANRSKLP